MANNSAESSRYPSHHPQRDRQPAANYATRSVESVGNPTLARAEVEPTFLRCSVRTSSTRDRRRLPSTSTPVSVTPSADWPRSSRAAVRYRPRAGDGHCGIVPLAEPAGRPWRRRSFSSARRCGCRRSRGDRAAELQDSLLGMGCEIGQGFLFSPPLELSLVRERLMAEGSTGLRVVSSA